MIKTYSYSLTNSICTLPSRLMDTRLMLPLLSLLFLDCATATKALAEPLEPSCLFTVGKVHFNLTDLRHAKTDYYGHSSRYNYTMNLCGPSLMESCANRAGSLCQFLHNATAPFVLASWSRDPYPACSFIDSQQPDQGIALTFDNGDACGKGSRQVQLRLHCTSKLGTTIRVTEVHECLYLVDLDAGDAACAFKPSRVQP